MRLNQSWAGIRERTRVSSRIMVSTVGTRVVGYFAWYPLTLRPPRSGWTRALQNPYTMAGRVPTVDTIIRDDTRVLSRIPAQLWFKRIFLSSVFYGSINMY